MTTGILFAFSRAAWLNLVIGALVMFVVLSLRRGGGRRALTVVVVGISAASVLFAEALALTSSFVGPERASAPAGVRHATVRRPGVGHRVGREDTHLESGPASSSGSRRSSAHSTYVRALSEEGVLGLLVLLALLLLTLMFASRNAILGRDTYGIGSAALLAAWCGLLANSVFIDTLHWRHFWLLAALIWAGAARTVQGSPGQTWPPASSRNRRSASSGRR